MPTSKRKGPCSECPFRRRSAPGWLGNSGPAGFLATTLATAAGTAAEAMPCHMDVDYSDPDWEEQLPEVAACAGALQMLNNYMLLPRDPEMVEMCGGVGRNDKVFATPAEFYDHHKNQTYLDKEPFHIQREDMMLERLQHRGYVSWDVHKDKEDDDEQAG